VVVATDFADSGADNPAFPGMLGQTLPNTGTTPRETLADAGYFSENNVEAAHGAGTDPLIATGRLAHGEKVPDAPRGRIPTNATPRARMARKLRTQKGKAAYARRKVIVEPVFGQMKTTQGAGRLLLRGHDHARSEWRLLVACRTSGSCLLHHGSAAGHRVRQPRRAWRRVSPVPHRRMRALRGSR